MTRHRFLLEVLDEGVAFERWTEDGHNEACFEAADGLHRVVTSQAAGQPPEEDQELTRALSEACPLCQADLRDAVALVKELEAEGPHARAAVATPAPPAPRSAAIPEPAVAVLQREEVQRADRPVSPRRHDPPAASAATARSGSGRLWSYGLAAVLVAGVAAMTLALLWQQHVTSQASHAPRGANASRRTSFKTTTNPRPTGSARATARGPASGRAVLPTLRRPSAPPPTMATPPLMRRAPDDFFPIPRPMPALRPVRPRPDPKDRGYGVLRINTVPWTKIWIDGRFRGKTPQLKIRLRAGRHKLELKNRQAAIRYTAYITIREGRPTTFIRRFNRR